MRRLEVTYEESRLIIFEPIEGRMLAIGCPLFALCVCCVVFLGILSIAHEASAADWQSMQTYRFLDTRHNHFGVLWLLGCLLLAGAIPLYAWRARIASRVYVFDRSRELFLRYNRPVCNLRKLEKLSIHREVDIDGCHGFNLFLAYNDGHDMRIHEGPSLEELSDLAEEIARFAGIPIEFPRAVARREV